MKTRNIALALVAGFGLIAIGCEEKKAETPKPADKAKVETPAKPAEAPKEAPKTPAPAPAPAPK